MYFAFDNLIFAFSSILSRRKHLAKRLNATPSTAEKSSYHRSQRLDSVGHSGWVNVRLSVAGEVPWSQKLTQLCRNCLRE